MQRGANGQVEQMLKDAVELVDTGCDDEVHASQAYIRVYDCSRRASVFAHQHGFMCMIKVISTLKERIKRKNGESFKTATRALCMLDECCLAADPHDAAFCTPLPPFVSLTLTHVLASLEKIATGNKGIFSFLNKKKPTGRSIEEEEMRDVARVVVHMWEQRYKSRPQDSKKFSPSSFNALPALTPLQTRFAAKWVTDGSAAVLANQHDAQPNDRRRGANSQDSALSLASTAAMMKGSSKSNSCGTGSSFDLKPCTHAIGDQLNLVEQMMYATKESGTGHDLLEDLLASVESYSSVLEQNIASAVVGESEQRAATNMLERYVFITSEVRRTLEGKTKLDKGEVVSDLKGEDDGGHGMGVFGKKDSWQSPIFTHVMEDAAAGMGKISYHMLSPED